MKAIKLWDNSQDELFMSRMYDHCSELLLDQLSYCEGDDERAEMWDQIIYLNDYVICQGLIEANERVTWAVCEELHRRGLINEDDFQFLCESVEGN